MNRFIAHIQRLGIPNPYSGYETYLADKRWKELHPLSVPTIQELTAQGPPHFDEVRAGIECDLSSRTATHGGAAALATGIPEYAS
ncbi:MAG: hypothetical protein U0790_22825 [Isosphaeraceae bacterium]